MLPGTVTSTGFVIFGALLLGAGDDAFHLKHPLLLESWNLKRTDVLPNLEPFVGPSNRR